MNEKIKALYLYCCDGSLPYESYYGVRDGLFLSLYEKYRTLKGRFWCNHNWQLFDIIPQGYSYVIERGAKCICTKCGKIGRRTPKQEDHRLIDYRRYISYS